MKQTFFFAGLLSLLVFNSLAQEKLSGHLNTGMIIPFNDYSNTDYWGEKTDVFLSGGLSYEIAQNLRLRGDLTFGNMDGDNNLYIFETSFYEGNLSLSYNIIPLFAESRFRFNINAGAGLMFYYSRLYDSQTRMKILESPVPSEKSVSPNTVISGGIELGYALSDNLDLNLGFNERAVIENDYMDGFKNGEANDFYGLLSLGLTFHLKDKKDPSKVEIDKQKYNKMVRDIDSLGESAVGPEAIAKMEMEVQEKEMRIRMLEKEVDSLRANVVSVDSDLQEKEVAQPDTEALLASSQYRVIVASLPSRTMAQRWIDRSQLDKSEMIIVHVADINTYRVIYKSFDNLAAAKKEKQSIRGIIPDAWIIKF